MSININKAQADFLSKGGDLGGTNIVEFGIVNSLLQQYGGDLQVNIAKYANQLKVVSSGELLDSMKAEFESINGTETFRLRMLNYYDYPNQGVKGVDSSRNAPSSQYQYKTYGMPKEALGSLKRYILSGKAKISSVKNDKALGIGLEKKGLNASRSKALIDRQVETMAYLIKSFGIKTTHYFDKAMQETFKDFDVVMSEALGRDIVLTLKKIKLK